MNDEMIDAPMGYYFGSVSGRTLRHLVKIEVYNSITLCGTQIFRESLTDIAHKGSKFCPKCEEKFGEIAENIDPRNP